MPRLLDTCSRTGHITAAINHLIVTDGLDGLSLRRIGAVARLSPSTIVSHYGSREHLLRVAAHQTGLARLRGIRSRIEEEGPNALLPSDDEDVLTARAWLAWCELWRTHDWIALMVQDIRQLELDELAHRYELRIPRDDLHTIVALVDGLVVAICQPARPMSPATAHRLLTRQVTHLLPKEAEHADLDGQSSGDFRTRPVA